MLKALLDYNSKENEWLRSHRVETMLIGCSISFSILIATVASARRSLRK